MEPVNLVVITTISSQDTPAVLRFLNFLEKSSLKAIVVADKKTPIWSPHPNIDFLSLEEQNDLWPGLSKALPLNHYSRKNLGYLRAMTLGADSILDTDDDNCPNSNPWTPRFEKFRINDYPSWINMYRYFGENDLWPRGLPLRCVHQDLIPLRTEARNFEISCFQSIVDGDPDIDAIGRLLFPKKVNFSENLPVLLGRGICPTNSQATLWSRWLFPLLYLPSNATFRMTDIWRGLVLQPAIQVLGGNTVFGKLGFQQVRNEHDLMKDFESEVSGHLLSERVSEISLATWSEGEYTRHVDSVLSGLTKNYELLVKHEIINPIEIKIVQEWVKAVEAVD